MKELVGFPDGIELAEFKPCKMVLEEIGITQYIFEDVSYFSRPVVEGLHHYVDWMISHDGKRLIGMQFWSVHK